MAKKSKAVEVLVVQSKVKNLVRSLKCNCSSDVAEGLSAVVHELISKGVERAKSNGRKTLRAANL